MWVPLWFISFVSLVSLVLPVLFRSFDVLFALTMESLSVDYLWIRRLQTQTIRRLGLHEMASKWVTD